MVGARIVIVQLTYTPLQLTSMHFYAWKKGLKTGMLPCPFVIVLFVILTPPTPGCYYLRTRAAVDAIKVTVDAPVAGKADCGLILRSPLFTSN